MTPGRTEIKADLSGVGRGLTRRESWILFLRQFPKVWSPWKMLILEPLLQTG